MWSIPVMYAFSSNVIPFPTDDAARARLSVKQIRLHAEALDRELEDLEEGNFGSPGEWAMQTATPIVRTTCIRGYLAATTTVHLMATAEERRRRRMDKARDDFRSALRATAVYLARLGDPSVDLAERQEVLEELHLQRMRHQHSLKKIDEVLNPPSRFWRLHFLTRTVTRRTIPADFHAANG